jgi:ABC-type dipeptide/oligopeptide/nickel transport system permease component
MTVGELSGRSGVVGATPDRPGPRLLREIAVRLFWLIVVIWAAVTLTFFLSRVVPADPARLAAGLQAGPEQVAEVRRLLGLDQPLFVQYVDYLTGLVQFDFGRSIQTRGPVVADLMVFLPATLELVVLAAVGFTVVGITLGVVWAVWPRGPHTIVIRLVAVTAVAVPVFWIGLVLQIVFASRLGWFPIAGNLDYEAFGVPLVTGASTIDALLAGNLEAFGSAVRHLTLPVVSLVLGQLALATRLTRASLSEQLQQPYVRSARARGVTEGRIVIVDALRNALNPVITMLALQFGWVLGGSVLIEVVYSYPGLGLYAFNAFRTFDYNPIMGMTIVVTIAFVVVNEITNSLYPVLDPRLRDRP